MPSVPAVSEKNPYAVSLGSLGGKIGGPVTASRLSPAQRRARARKGGLARAQNNRAAELDHFPPPVTMTERNSQILALANTRRFTYPQLARHFDVSPARIQQIVRDDPYTWKRVRKGRSAIELLERANGLYSDSMAGMTVDELAAKYRLSRSYVWTLLGQ